MARESASRKIACGPSRPAQPGFFIPFKAIGSRVNSAFSAFRAAFKSGQVSQTLFDILCICAGALLVLLFGLSIVVACFILLFGWR